MTDIFILLCGLLFNNGLILQFGIIRNVRNNASHDVLLSISYNNYYIGFTDMIGNLNNGVVTRFNYVSLSSCMIGYDVPAAVYVTGNKYWITIGY